MKHYTSITALTLAAVMAVSAAPLPSSDELWARQCETKVNPGLHHRCVNYINKGISGPEVSAFDKREVVGIANDDHDLTATFHGTTFSPIIGRRDDTVIGIGNQDSNSHIDLSDAKGIYISGGNKRDVGILNHATGTYSFNDATIGPIVGDQYVNRRDDGDVGVKNGATGGGDYDGTVWGPQVGDRYIGYSTVSKRDDGDVGVKNGATGGGDYDGTVWGPQVGDRYIGYSTVNKRDGNNDADPCPGVPVGPSVGTTYMPTHPSTNYKRCSSTPIAPTDGGVVYTKRQEETLSERDGNNDADPCPGVPVGPSVGTTYMPTHPSTNYKRCSSTPIAPTDGGIVYTRNAA